MEIFFIRYLFYLIIGAGVHTKYIFVHTNQEYFWDTTRIRTGIMLHFKDPEPHVNDTDLQLVYAVCRD